MFRLVDFDLQVHALLHFYFAFGASFFILRFKCIPFLLCVSTLRLQFVVVRCAGVVKGNKRYICEAVCDAVRECSEVTRPSADCQTTFFRRFKQLGTNLKKVIERSRDSGRRSRDRRLTVKQRFLDVSSNLGKF